MKKYFSRIIIPLFIFTIIFGGFTITHGQENVVNNISGTAPALTGAEAMGAQANQGTSPGSVAAPATYQQMQYQSGVSNTSGQGTTPQSKPAEGSWYDAIVKGFSALAEGPLRLTMGVIAGFWQLVIIPVLSFILGITGSIIDIGIKFTLDSGNISGAGLNGAVVKVWTIVRNIFNITFIFILLYTAIRTIIGSANANTKKTIANVIIAALLINFSLLITRVIIDAGNILGVTLYNLATNNGVDTFASVVVKNMSIAEAWKGDGFSVFHTQFFIVTAVQALTLLTTIVVFAYIAALMLARSVMLVFLMVLSPIGFMGDILPAVSAYSKMWRENLLGQVFVAPIFLLFFYLIKEIGTNLTPTGLAKEEEAFSIYFKYIMIIIMLFAAVKITKKMSGVVGGMVEKFGGMAAGVALGVATGGAAFVAKRTIGAGAEALKNSAWGERMKDSGTIGSRLMLKGLDKTAKSTFDARNTSTFKSATGLIGSQTGIKVDYNAGVKIKKGGFQGMVEAREKSAEEFGKMVTKNMPKVNIQDERKDIEARLAENQRKITEINNNPSTTQEDIDRREELEKEKNALEERKKLDDKKLEEKIEKERKDARLEVQAAAEEKGKINWIMGGKAARKAAAAKIRKLKGEKSKKEKLLDEVMKEAKEEGAKEAKEKEAAGGAAPAAPAATPPVPPPAK